MNKNWFEKNMHGLKRCLYALSDGINVLLKTLYMYRYDFEHAE